MTEIIDGYERAEIPPAPNTLCYGAVFRKDGCVKVVWIDRILVDRYGPEWRRRQERKTLSGIEPDHFVSGAIPKGDDQE